MRSRVYPQFQKRPSLMQPIEKIGNLLQAHIQEAPGGGGCVGMVPGMTNPGGSEKLAGIPGN